MKSGLDKIMPDNRDYSLLHTFGAIAPDPKGLPLNFSIYDGRVIPNQDDTDTRFNPPLNPLPYGCTGETASFDSGIQDGAVYRPDVPYVNTAPYTVNNGRDMRVMLGALCNKDVLITQDQKRGVRRTAYFNCYGKGGIDDFDAARIALYLFQNEKRGVWVGSWWYAAFAVPNNNGTLPSPSYNTNDATLHAHLITGWVTINGTPYLEDISWQGGEYGDKGKVYFSREEYNALMQQPYTGAFTITKYKANAPVAIGFQAIIDHLIYFLVQIFVNQKKTS